MQILLIKLIEKQTFLKKADFENFPFKNSVKYFKRSVSKEFIVPIIFFLNQAK